jgi:hypothetical protein
VSAAPKPATRRQNHGRGHSYLLDGAKVRGVTTIIGDAIPKPALINWAANTTADYAVDHWTHLTELGPAARIKELKGARYADVDKAAKRGTEVHGLADQLNRGHQVDVPDDLAGHVESYLRFLTEWNPTVLHSEAVLFSRTYRYGGTLDLIADMDGQRYLCDVKTSRSGVYGETGLQLAAYRYADFLLDDDGEQIPLPEVDATAVIWVRGDGYDVVPVEAGPDQFKVFRHAAWLGQHTADMREWVHDALRPPAQIDRRTA